MRVQAQCCHLLRLRLLLKGLLDLLLTDLALLTGLLLTGLLLADLAGDTDLAFAGLELMVFPAASCAPQQAAGKPKVAGRCPKISQKGRATSQ